MQTLRARPILVIALLVVIALLLNGVAYAIDRFVGYIPGFGFTSGSQAVLVLDAPISQTHNGITLRVDKVVSDGNRFWVEMTVSGYSYFEAMYSRPSVCEAGTAACAKYASATPAQSTAPGACIVPLLFVSNVKPVPGWRKIASPT